MIEVAVAVPTDVAATTSVAVAAVAQFGPANEALDAVQRALAADAVEVAARVLAMALAACAIASVAAFTYRWYGGQRAPEGVPILLGLSVIAIWLNTTDILSDTLANGGVGDHGTAALTVGTFVVATIGADAGRRVGDHLASDLPSVRAVRGIDADVGQLVRAAGRVVRVTVPEEVDDIDGYEPVAPELRAELAGTTFLFPRGLTVAELRERFADRLKHDYDVGHVDVELAADGSVEYLALGRRLAGIGQTLAPGSVAVAIRADPAFSATPGDRVQIWRPGSEAAGGASEGGAGSAGADGAVDEETDAEQREGDSAADTGRSEVDSTADTDRIDGDSRDATPRRVATGELRAAVDDVATVVVDEADADALADDVRYRLATLPASAQSDREFAALLRAADETMAAVAVEAGSALVDQPVRSIDLTVVGLQRDGTLEALPDPELALAAGDRVYAIGRLDAIRRLEARAIGTGEAGDAPDNGGTGASPSDAASRDAATEGESSARPAED